MWDESVLNFVRRDVRVLFSDTWDLETQAPIVMTGRGATPRARDLLICTHFGNLNLTDHLRHRAYRDETTMVFLGSD